MPGHLRLASPTERADGASIRIVLAEDHAVVRRNLRQLLDREDGVDVVAEAEDLSSATGHVHGLLPRVLVLDLEMHDGSSIDAVRSLRTSVPETEIVVVTMETSPVFAQQAIDAGAVGFVRKDRAETELPVAVRLAARGEEYVSPEVASGLDALRAAAGDGLSPRETEVLRLIALGYTSVEIASRLNLSSRTVESHRARIHRKLGLATRAELVAYALQRHLIGD